MRGDEDTEWKTIGRYKEKMIVCQTRKEASEEPRPPEKISF